MVKDTIKAILIGLAALARAFILEEPEFLHTLLEHRKEGVLEIIAESKKEFNPNP